MAPLSIVHVVNGGIGVGGAERMLSRIVRGADRTRFQHSVLTILPCQYLQSEMQGAGAPFVSLDVERGARVAPLLLARSLRLRKLPSAQLFVGWLNYGNVFASILGAAHGGVPVVLNFRGTYSESDLRRPVMRVMRALAPRAARRLANSRAALGTLEAAGFGHVDFIANGFSPEEFHRDPAGGAAARAKHGIPAEAIVFGHVGRFHPMKNQAGLVHAAQQVLEADPGVHLMLVGRGMTTSLKAQLSTSELSSRVHLIEGVDDPRAVYSAMDVYVHSSSWGEGFPNVIAEAMLHDLPVVCTDVAESRSIAGTGNLVVPPCDEPQLAAAMLQTLRMTEEERVALGAANRARIASVYSAERVVREFETHFSNATGNH